MSAATPEAPGPFAFADRARVGRILQEAGWIDIAFEAVDFAYIAGAGEAAEEDAVSFFQSIGPAAAAAVGLPDTERRTFLAKLERYVAAHVQNSLVALPGAAWMVTARTP